MRMSVSWFRPTAGWPFHLLAVGATGLAIGHVLVSEHRLDETLIEIGITLVLVLGFVFVGIRFPRADLLPNGRTRILFGTVLFGTTVMTLVALLIAVRSLGRPADADAAFSLFLAWTFGASLGTLLTFYYERVKVQRRRLERSMAETDRLYRHLSLNQRVLRHNLRNDLNVIIGVTDQLLGEPRSDASTARLETVVGAAERLLDTSETSLAIQRVMERGDVQAFDLATVTRRVFDEFEAREVPATLDTDRLDSSPVTAHPQLPAAIRELVENAIEHNEPDGLAVTASTERVATDGEVVRLVIADTGTGIPTQERQAIEGRPETQLNHASGLGLWFVRTVVEQSGGTIDADENEPRGTRFIIDLPVRTG